MQFVAGIDGGGTKTLLKIADLDGNLLACFEGGPANIHGLSRPVLAKTLGQVLSGGLRIIKGDIRDCRAICIGAAGMGRPAEKKVMAEIIRELGFSERLVVTDDAHIALIGGVDGSAGIILISGTGSICYGRNEQGETCRAGGWGYIAGDEGSGYDIGLHAIRYTLRCLDGREKEAGSVLPGMVLKALGAADADELIGVVYGEEGKKKVASLAPVVDEAFSQGDSHAGRILDQSVEELFQCAEAVAGRLPFDKMPVRLAFGGSVLLKSDYLRSRLKLKLTKAYPFFRVTDIKDDAAWGAVLLALSQANERENI